MDVPFSKYSGCGNDFIIFDNRIPFFYLDTIDIQKLCNRQRGIGADGLILLEKSSRAAYKMRIFNSDGSEAEMCGNGLRCLLKFMRQKGLKKKQYTIETMHLIQEAAWENGDILIKAPFPIQPCQDVMIAIDNSNLLFHYLDTGVPHAVHFLEQKDKLADIPLEKIAPTIRHHSFFGPRGTNVNFVKIMSANRMEIRTYERGVEQETLACGTGAMAAALASAHQYQISSPITLCPASGEDLVVSFLKESNQFSNVCLKGPAHFIFEGKIQLKKNS